MQKSKFSKMRHYVGFWQIGSQMSKAKIDYESEQHIINCATSFHLPAPFYVPIVILQWW